MVRSLVLAALCAVCLLGVLEFVLRGTGLRRSTTNDVNLWCRERARVPRLDRNDILLLGSSRMQQDCSPSVIRRRYPGREVVQLAIDGGQSYAALQDIANRSEFAGLVVCDIHMGCISRLDAPSDIAREWSEEFHSQWTLDRRLNCEIQQAVRSHLAVTAPTMGINGLVRSIALRRLTPREPATGFDRQLHADLTVHTPGVLEGMNRRWSRDLPPERARYDLRGRAAWERDARTVGELVRKIEGRGGRVVFAVFPVSGAMRREYERLYPRGEFWKPFLRLTGAPGLDCTLLPAFETFHCPEGSHLDRRESARFTEALCGELERIGML